MSEKLVVELEQVEALSLERIQDYLLSVGVLRACEACGASAWEIDQNGDRVAFTLTPLSDNPDAGLVLLPLTCQTCGSMRHVNAVHMTRRILEKETKSVQ
ncbi:hypothetical protein PPUJ13061_32290 [Pseudomonas putida]|nr:hypothetical protein PPUJ13061_32290 [Pseudomonas putida]